MSISEEVKSRQDVKEMTRLAIKILIAAGEEVNDLINEFEITYSETL